MLAGAALGGGMPEWLLLEHAVPLFLLAEVVQVARNRPALTAALIGAGCAVAGGSLPLHEQRSP